MHQDARNSFPNADLQTKTASKDILTAACWSKPIHKHGGKGDGASQPQRREDKEPCQPAYVYWLRHSGRALLAEQLPCQLNKGLELGLNFFACLFQGQVSSDVCTPAGQHVVAHLHGGMRESARHTIASTKYLFYHGTRLQGSEQAPVLSSDFKSPLSQLRTHALD
eukprot:1160288-Pelagomonas_calceolata.AAC.2